MDFDKLFTLLVEADEATVQPSTDSGTDELPATDDTTNTDGTGVATPDDYAVEPAPQAPVVDHNENVQSIKGYIDKLTSFADELNSPNGSSLNDYVNQIDDENGPYKGISSLGRKIISAAVDLRGLIEDLNGYRIAAQKQASAPKPVVPGAPTV